MPGRGINIAIVDRQFAFVERVRFDTHTSGKDADLRNYLDKLADRWIDHTILVACYDQCNSLTSTTYTMIEQKLGSALSWGNRLGYRHAWALIAQAMLCVVGAALVWRGHW